MIILSIILIIVGFYLSIGFVFALLFVTKGITRIDEGAHNSGWGFRLIIIPGTIIFWPLLLIKWKNAVQNKTQ